jgi:hypothetical protein
MKRGIWISAKSKQRSLYKHQYFLGQRTDTGVYFPVNNFCTYSDTILENSPPLNQRWSQIRIQKLILNYGSGCGNKLFLDPWGST